MLNKEKEKSQEKPSKKRSVWDFFTKVELPDGSKKANCNNCEKLLGRDSKKHGTSQLWRHLKSCGGTEPRNKDARTTLPSHSSGNRENHLGNSQQTNTDPSGCQDNNLGENHFHLGYVQQINTEPTGNQDNQLGYLQQTNAEPSGCQENHLGYAQPINTEPSGNRENQLGYVQQTNTEPSGSQEKNIGENHLGYVQQINIEPSGNRENQLGYLQQTNTEPSGSQEKNIEENHLGYVQQINTEPSGNRENQLGYLQQTNTEPSGSQEKNIGENHLGYVQQINIEPSGNREKQLGYLQQTNTEPSGSQENNLGENCLGYVQQQLGYLQQTNTEPSGSQENNLGEICLRYVQQQLGYLEQTNTEPSGSQEKNIGENHLGYVQQINIEPSGNREKQLGYLQQTNTEPSGSQENNLGENCLGYVQQQLGYLQQTNTEPSESQENNLGENCLGYVQQQLGYLQQSNTEPSGSQENNLGENCLGYVQQMNKELFGNRENQSEYDPQKNRELFVKMVIDNKTMLEHVENPFLQEFARFLQPLYSHVTRRDVEEDCLTFYKKEKALLKEKIINLTSKVSLSVVSYYNRKAEFLEVCVAAHFIDNDFKLFKRIIGFMEEEFGWSIEGIDYERVLNGWGLCNKVFAWSRGECYIRDAGKTSATLDVKCILECFCSIAHEIQLAIKSDVYSIKRMMEDLNEFPEKMCYFNEIAGHHDLASKFEFVLTNKGLLGIDLNILNEACTYKNVLCTFVDMNVAWSKVEEVVDLLNKINDVVVMLSSLEFPTSNLLLKYVFEISDVLSEASPVLSGGTKDAIDRSLAKLDGYLASCDCILLIASLLDPRFKLRFPKRCIGKFIANEEDFDKSFCSLYNKYQSESREIDKFDRLSEIPELKKYLNGRVEEGDVNFDVLGWWKDNELVYPILSRMARDILAIATSVSFTSQTERVKDIIEEIFGSTMDTEMSKVMVCCNNWLRASRATGKSVDGIENIIKKRHLDQAFPEHSDKSNNCVYDQIKCLELLAKLVISCELPFHFVKSTWFIEWAKNLQPLYTPVDVTSIKTKCLGFYQIERQKFKNLHKKTFVNSAHRERVCFSAHLAGELPNKYICVIAHFIDNDFNLVRRNIATEIITYEEYLNPAAISAQLQKCMDNWELPKKVLAFTIGNFGYERHEKILGGLTYGVGAIKLHCIVEGLFKRLLEFIWDKLYKVFSSIRKMIEFLDEDPNKMHTFNQLSIEHKINSPKLYIQLDEKRRWDSAFNMLSDALAYQDVFHAYKVTDESFPLCENWNEVKSAVKFLKPIYEAIIIFCSSQYPTSNLFLKIVFEIHDVLSHFVFNTNNNYDKEGFLDCLMKISNSYLKDCNNLLLAASLLDPRFKLTYLERCYMEHISDRDEIEKFIGNLCIKLKYKHDRGMLELKRYLQESHVNVSGDDFDVLRWWNDNKSNFPILSRIACHILAIPVSSLPSESAFSHGCYWETNSNLMRFGKLANQLGPRTLEALVCSHNWLSDASSNGKFTQKEAATDLVEKHIPPSYKCPLRACDLWSITYLKRGLWGRMSEEIVAIGDAKLTAENMQCLIQPIDRWIPTGNIYRQLITKTNTKDKWIPDEVINCYIGIMNNQGGTLGKILILGTFDSRLLESWGSSVNHRDKLHQHIIKKGKGFLQNELVFLPICEQNHWFVGAFNASKREFQILNSLNSEGTTYKEATHNLRLGIHLCIDAALDSQGTVEALRPKINVVNWPISVISNLPQQKDGCSCGLFALKYMQLWDGSKLATEFTQDDIDLFRKQLAGELIFSELNEKKDIQDKIKKGNFYTEESDESEELG